MRVVVVSVELHEGQKGRGRQQQRLILQSLQACLVRTYMITKSCLFGSYCFLSFETVGTTSIVTVVSRSSCALSCAPLMLMFPFFSSPSYWVNFIADRPGAVITSICVPSLLDLGLNFCCYWLKNFSYSAYRLGLISQPPVIPLLPIEVVIEEEEEGTEKQTTPESSRPFASSSALESSSRSEVPNSSVSSLESH